MPPKSKLQKKKDNPRSTYWKSKADKLWGELIHLDGSCAVCGSSEKKLEAHHLISRAVVNTRHDPRNGILLCSWHHKYCPQISPHAGPIGFSRWLEENNPEQYEFVLKNRNKIDKPDYKEAYHTLTVCIDQKSDGVYLEYD